MQKSSRYLFILVLILSLAAALKATAADELKIVYSAGVAPLEFEDSASRPAGLLPDLWRLWAKKAGSQIEFVRADTVDESLQMLKDGAVDLHAGLLRTAARETFLDYSEPLLTLDDYIFTHPSVYPINTLDKTAGLIIGIQKGSYAEQIVRSKVPANRIAAYDRAEDLFRAALEGEIKVFIATELRLLYFLRENYQTNIFEYDRDRPLFSQMYYTATRKGNRALIQQVNDGLKAIGSAYKKQLTNKWVAMDFKEMSKTAADGAAEKETRVGMSSAEENFLKSHPVIRVHNEKDWPQQAVGPISYGRLALYGLVIFLILTLLTWLLIRTIQKANISVNFGSRWFRGLVLAGLTLFIVIVCLLGLFTLEQSREAILKSIGDTLKETLKTADNRLSLWVAQRTSLLKLLGRDPELVTLTKRLLAVAPNPDNLKASEALQDVRTFFKDNKNFLSNSDFFIINANHNTIGSMHDASLGRPNVISVHKPDLIRRAFEGDVLFVPPIQLDDAAASERQAHGGTIPSTKFFIGPILDSNGQILALVALGVDPAKDFSWVLPASDTRNSDETYAFDEQGRMLSESRFDDQLRRIGLLAGDQTSFLNIEIKDPGVNLVKGQRSAINRSQQPLTRMASRAIQLKLDMEKAGQTVGRSNMEIDTNGYRDYRGVPVFGAWLWNAELGLGLATEIDLKDAMSPYYQVRRTVVGVLGFTLLASVGAVLLVLMLGERTSRALMKARDNLEAKVGERTAELQEKQAQLEAAVERSRLILDSAGEGIFGVNPQGEAAFINPAANRMLGYESDELIGQNVHEVIHHSYADGSSYPMEKCPMYMSYAHGTDHHVANEVLWGKDGSAFSVEYTSMPIKKDGRVVGAVITFMDIAERMEAEEAARRNQEQLQVVLESIQAVAFLKDRQGRHLLVNRFYENAVGVKKEDIIGKTDLEVFPPEAARQIMALDEQVMSSGKIQTVEEEIPHPDGSLHAYLTTKVPLFDKDGVAYGMCGLATDITDRKRMEETLALEHERLQKILDTSPVGVGISTGGVVRFANPRFAELFCSRKGEEALDAYVDPKDRDYIVNQLKRTGIVRDYELQTYGPNREIRETLATFISTEHEGQSGILAWMVDLSKLKEAEKELRARFEELDRFRRLAIGREQKMIELKKEINELLISNGLSEKYKIH